MLRLEGRAAVVTGGASGIGRALRQAFARSGARGVVVSDIDGPGADEVAAGINAGGPASWPGWAERCGWSLRGAGAAIRPAARDGVLEPEQVAEVVLEGLAEERFLILPHPQVATCMQRRGNDHERWLGGMRRAQQTLRGAVR